MFLQQLYKYKSQKCETGHMLLNVPRPFYILVACDLNKQQSPFGTKIRMDICPRTLSVSRSKQFSESVVQGKL